MELEEAKQKFDELYTEACDDLDGEEMADFDDYIQDRLGFPE